MQYAVTKLGRDSTGLLVEDTVKEFETLNAALRYLNRLAKEEGWQFVADRSLFGGYFVDAQGNAYQVK